MAKLLGIKLENFKSFKNLDLPIPEGFTAIVGPNGAGKCLLGNSLLHLDTGKISIEKLFEKIKKNYLERKIENNTEILIPREKYLIFSVNLDTLNIEKKEILAITKRREKRFAILRTKYKREIEATLNHPFFVLEKNKIVSKPLSFLKKGEKILTYPLDLKLSFKKEKEEKYNFSSQKDYYLENLPDISFLLKEAFNMDTNSFIDKKGLLQILEFQKVLNKKIYSKEALKLLENLAKTPLTWDEIEDIEVIEKEVYVYDIQVKDNSNFFANDILVHNSNIVDAFCFILGKGSSKALRGKTFKDLITLLPKRPKEGKVCIFFSINDKEKEKLNAKSNLLALERKIYLDKDETSYRIYYLDGEENEIFNFLREKKGNEIFKRTIKTKKISKSETSDILSKLNLPPHAPNVIQQGDLLKIISMSNLERRKVIDEICGIWEFEEKKEKALEELKVAREYLEKIEVRLLEVKNLLDHLKKEVEKLEKYEKLKRKLNLLLDIYYLRLYIFYKNRIRKLKETLQEKRKILENIELELENLKKHKKNFLEKLSEIDAKIFEFKEGEYKEKFENYSKINIEISNLSKEIKDLENKLKALENKLSLALEEKENLSFQKDTLEKDLSNLRSLLKDLLEDIKILEEKRKKISNSYLKLSQKLEELSEKEKNLLEKFSKLSQEIQNLSHKIEILKKERDIKLKEIENLKSLKEQLTKEIENLKNEKYKYDIKDILNRLEAIKEEEFSLKDDIKKLTEEIKTLEKEREKIFRELIEEEAKIKNLEKYSVSYDEALKKLMQANLPGIIDIVGNLGKTSLEYKTALEASAGGRLNFIVVDTFENTKRIIEFLKRHNLPRFTFLPLDTIRYRETPYIEHEKIIGRAIDLIEFEEKYRPIFEFVFYGTYIVRNLDDARELFEIYPNWRFVTLEGDILEPSGAVSGGKLKSRAQISIKIDYSHLETLKNKLKEISKNLEEKKNILENLKRKLSSLEKEEFSLKHHLKEIERKKQTTSKKLEKLTCELESIEPKIFALNKDIENISKKIKILENEKKEKEVILSNLEKEINVLKQEKESIKNNEILKELSSLEEILSKKKGLYERYEKEFKEKSLKLEKIDLKLSSLEENINSLKEEISILKETLNLRKKLYEKKKEELSRLEKEFKALEEKLKKLEEDKTFLKKNIENIEKEIEKKQREREKIKEEIYHFEKEIEKSKVYIEDIKKVYPKIEYYLDISRKEDIENILTSNGFKKEEFESYLNLEIDSIEREIKDIKAFLKSLGEINFQAKKDYKEVYERHKELLEKWEIYKKEEEKYLHLLEEIEKRKKEVFLETFRKIRKAFQEIYEKLGGKGDILLENEKDPLKAGIIIKATPKGKKLININSMSGGEKALAALSFIFAIARLFNAPFYILDEVDAPLDVKNAALVGKLIKEYSKEKDFIVISHREQTISSADNIFGVTMENGLSKVVGIKI